MKLFPYFSLHMKTVVCLFVCMRSNNLNFFQIMTNMEEREPVYANKCRVALFFLTVEEFLQQTTLLFLAIKT